MVSVSGCSVDFQEASPGFGSSSSFQRTEYSGSGNTDDFIREVTESHNISFSNNNAILTKMNSEDEISNPFSLSSSRHSLLIVESDPEKDGSESPEQLDSPQETKEKESRSSYSLISCPISRSLPEDKITTAPELENIVPASVLITPSDDEDNVPISGSVHRLSLPPLTRQSAVYELEQTDVLRLTPTNLSANQGIDYESLASPTTPTPQTEMKTDGEPSADLSTTETDELELLLDDIMSGESDQVRIRVPVPMRRHSTCESTSREVTSLLQRRTSLTTLPSFTPLPAPSLHPTLTPSHMLCPPIEDTRKLSDPAVCLRKERLKNSYIQCVTRQKRCLSDSDPPNFSVEDDDCKSEGCGSSALDSGYHDSRYHDGSSMNYPPSSRVSLDNFSDDYRMIEPPLVSPSKTRRPTPFSPFAPKTDGNNHVIWPWEDSSQPGGNHSNAIPPVVPPAKRSLPSRQSQSSIATSSESVSVSSFWESQLSQVSAVELLSSLGFDDFESPQLIPDRFIPKEVEQAKPSVMQGTAVQLDDEESVYMSRPPSICSMSESSVSSSQPPVRPLTYGAHDIPLGATAENFVPPSSPPPQPSQSSAMDKLPTATSSSQTNSHQFRYTRVLETVPEETASDLSPSPRWLSPRVSIDHSVIDFAAGNLGASLNVQKVRKRSLPTQRDGYRLSVGSLVESDTGDSIHVSVTSYDDEMALEKEKEKEESSVPIPVEDCTNHRRLRRKGVYVPPASLLTWLNSQETISEEEQNPEELPWPFNEQAKLRVSLTEIQFERRASETEVDQSSAPGFEPTVLSEPVCNILDSSSRSPSIEPHGRLSLSSLGSHDLERSFSPDEPPRTNSRETTLVPPSFKRRSRSLSPIIPLREEAVRRATGRVSQTTDDIQLGTAGGGSTLSHASVITHEDHDYRAECTWLRSELSSHEARARSTENTLRAEVDSLQTKLCSTEKRLTRQASIYQDLQQVQAVK